MIQRCFLILLSCISMAASAVDGLPDGPRPLAGADLSSYFVLVRNLFAEHAAPVPLAVRQKLARYFPANVLTTAKYAIAPQVVITTRTVLNDAHLRAAALLDVIVFQTAADANDLVLWAHQLQLVRDYLERGRQQLVDDYSSRPPRAQARADIVERRVAADLAAASQARSTPPPSAQSEPAAQVPAGTRFMVHNCKASGLTCELDVYMVQGPGETIPCACRDAFGMLHEGTAF